MKNTEVFIILDIETLGTSYDSEILEIGAVAIRDYKIIDEFERKIILRKNISINTETLKWHLSNGNAFDIMFGGERVPLENALKDFNDFLENQKKIGECVLIGNGPTFDITILESAYSKINETINCEFRKYRDLRTYKECYELLTEMELVIKDEDSLLKHRALDDAKSEAKVLIAILKVIKD